MVVRLFIPLFISFLFIFISIFFYILNPPPPNFDGSVIYDLFLPCIMFSFISCPTLIPPQFVEFFMAIYLCTISNPNSVINHLSFFSCEILPCLPL